MSWVLHVNKKPEQRVKSPDKLWWVMLLPHSSRVPGSILSLGYMSVWGVLLVGFFCVHWFPPKKLQSPLKKKKSESVAK